ncbi:MAG: esterase [Azospira oryzae]|jgi:S-formylglutathione hydrolase FrmB|nr:MAG: esterase [Azospira oryzae]
MSTKRKILSFLFSLVFLPLVSTAAKIDSLDIPSAAMKKVYKAVVVLPASYSKSKAAYPVLYLLHGGFGHYRDWLVKTPDTALLQNLSDQYNLIIVLPEGELFSYYIDSPIDKGSQFESYIIKDVIPKIDTTYRTNRSSKARTISGLSMGGYGAFYLSARHPELFCAAGSMSGALNPDMMGWKLPPEMANNIKNAFGAIMGPIESVDYSIYSIISMADVIKKNGTKLIFDCGVDDFLVEPNRELHRRLLFNQTPHDYAERPGAHSWDYWQNSLPHHVLFFHEVLKANKTTVN